MRSMMPGRTISAAGRSGDFTLPNDAKVKFAFIAGGIGITPFRSMVKYITDRNSSRDIVLFYSNKIASEIVYEDVFAKAKPFGVKTVYTLTDKESVDPSWKGQIGRIDRDMIVSQLPDYKERIFYLSGPNSLVNGFRDVLKNMGIPEHNIKTDFFPGFM